MLVTPAEMVERWHPDAIRSLFDSLGLGDLITGRGAGGRRVHQAAGSSPVFAMPVSATAEQVAWRRLAEAFPRTGLWPYLTPEPPSDSLIVGEPDWGWWDAEADVEPPAGTSEADVVVAELIMARQEVLTGRTLPAEPEGSYFDVAVVAAEIESATAGSADDARLSPPTGDLWLNLAPISSPARLPRYLSWYGASSGWSGPPWHESLTLDDVEALLSSWLRRFGARIRYLGQQALELAVEHPPTDVMTKAQVSIEQFAFCFDLAQLGFDTPAAIGRTQAPRHSWYFWWD